MYLSPTIAVKYIVRSSVSARQHIEKGSNLMFFCDPCAKKRNWPQSISKSHGVCEICDITARCNDVPSSALPRPAKVIEPEYVGKHRKD